MKSTPLAKLFWQCFLNHMVSLILSCSFLNQFSLYPSANIVFLRGKTIIFLPKSLELPQSSFPKTEIPYQCLEDQVMVSYWPCPSLTLSLVPQLSMPPFFPWKWWLLSKQRLLNLCLFQTSSSVPPQMSRILSLKAPSKQHPPREDFHEHSYPSQVKLFPFILPAYFLECT